jgi:hypothetical protein
MSQARDELLDGKQAVRLAVAEGLKDDPVNYGVKFCTPLGELKRNN